MITFIINWHAIWFSVNHCISCCGVFYCLYQAFRKPKCVPHTNIKYISSIFPLHQNYLIIYFQFEPQHKKNTLFLNHFHIFSYSIITFFLFFFSYGSVKSIVKPAMFNYKQAVWTESWEGSRDLGALWKAQPGKCSAEWEIWGCIYSQLSRFLSVCVHTDAHVQKNIVFMFAFSGNFKKKN